VRHESNVFYQTKDTHIVSEGNLTIRNDTFPVILPFTLPLPQAMTLVKKRPRGKAPQR